MALLQYIKIGVFSRHLFQIDLSTPKLMDICSHVGKTNLIIGVGSIINPTGCKIYFYFFLEFFYGRKNAVIGLSENNPYLVW